MPRRGSPAPARAPAAPARDLHLHLHLRLQQLHTPLPPLQRQVGSSSHNFEFFNLTAKIYCVKLKQTLQQLHTRLPLLQLQPLQQWHLQPLLSQA